MAQLTRPVDPFGEVDVYRSATGGLGVVAKVLMLPDIEGTRCGLALDASASMKSLYGVTGMVSTAFKSAAAAVPNLVEPVARSMAAFLANFAHDGKVSLLYWAVSPDGSATEEIGRFSGDDVQTVPFGGPKKMPWGRGTKLLPAVRYFVESAFDGAPWAIGVFVTDGIVEDIADVKTYCMNFGQQIAAGQRKPCKFVLIGLGHEVSQDQMEELDDMFEGSGLKTPEGDEIDIWDHKLASEMQKLEEVFAEVVSENVTVVASGKIVDQKGRVAREFPDGVPAFIRFELPADATSFTLDFPGGSIKQDISEVLGRL